MWTMWITGLTSTTAPFNVFNVAQRAGVQLPALELGFTNIIIEKPMIIRQEIDSKTISLINNASIFMVKNYLFSFVHDKVKELINELDLTPELLLTNFSKNGHVFNPVSNL